MTAEGRFSVGSFQSPAGANQESAYCVRKDQIEGQNAKVNGKKWISGRRVSAGIKPVEAGVPRGFKGLLVFTWRNAAVDLGEFRT